MESKRSFTHFTVLQFYCISPKLQQNQPWRSIENLKIHSLVLLLLFSIISMQKYVCTVNYIYKLIFTIWPSIGIT